MLTERKIIGVKVFYTWSQTESGEKYDPGFGKKVSWDVPLLDDYDYCFVNNVSTDPGSHHYKGIQNPSLIEEIKEWNATAILIYGWNFKSHFKALRFFKNKIPVLFRGDSTLLDEKNGIKKILRRIFLKYVYTYVDVALYAGAANKNYFKAHGLRDAQLEWMPHAIDNKRFEATLNTRNEAASLRQKLNISTNATVFLFAGKLEEKKQPDFLAHIFCNLAIDATILLIAGSGVLEKYLKEKYSPHPQIRFLDFVNQEQMPIVYACCDVFVLPSKGPGETWGLSINEAMAAGKAVIASDACGAAYDLFRDATNGFVFERNNAEMLKKSLRHFCADRTAAARMGEESAKKIGQYSFINECLAVERRLLNTGRN